MQSMHQVHVFGHVSYLGPATPSFIFSLSSHVYASLAMRGCDSSYDRRAYVMRSVILSNHLPTHLHYPPQHVVHRIPIQYDAFVRSLGASPMPSWYQKTCRVRKNGRSSDFRMFHSKLKGLALASILIGVYKQNLENYEGGIFQSVLNSL